MYLKKKFDIKIYSKMTKSKNKVEKNNKSNLYKAIIAIVLLAFIILILSDLFTSKPKHVYNHNISKAEAYKFTKQGELSFQSADGKYIDTIDIEFADNEHERAQGLMYRTEMAENQGMLFIFPTEARQSFYMKNTVIPLDMFFINSKFEIVTIHKNTSPYDLNSNASTSPAQYVLETIAGYTDKYNIKVGDKVIFRKTN